MNKPLVWVTGAGGLIGGYLVRTASQFAPGCSVLGLGRADLDLTDFSTVQLRFERERPTCIIHCAAMTRNPECQLKPQLARRINVEATHFLSRVAADIPFIFFSTDLVFDGKCGNYDEMAAVNPLSVYAETKAAAEKFVLANPKHTVIRTSLNGGVSITGDRGFNEQLRRDWEAGKMLTLFTDEFRCPIPAVVTAQAVWQVARQQLTGLYHLAGNERLSRWQTGSLLAKRWPQLRPRLEAGSAADYKGAPRSLDPSLNCAKIQRFLSFRLPGLTEWLNAHPDEPF